MHSGRRNGGTGDRILPLTLQLLVFQLLVFQLLGLLTFQLRVYLLILRHHTAFCFGFVLDEFEQICCFGLIRNSKEVRMNVKVASELVFFCSP